MYVLLWVYHAGAPLLRFPGDDHNEDVQGAGIVNLVSYSGQVSVDANKNNIVNLTLVKNVVLIKFLILVVRNIEKINR